MVRLTVRTSGPGEPSGPATTASNGPRPVAGSIRLTMASPLGTLVPVHSHVHATPPNGLSTTAEPEPSRSAGVLSITLAVPPLQSSVASSPVKWPIVWTSVIKVVASSQPSGTPSRNVTSAIVVLIVNPAFTATVPSGGAAVM